MDEYLCGLGLLCSLRCQVRLRERQRERQRENERSRERVRERNREDRGGGLMSGVLWFPGLFPSLTIEPSLSQELWISLGIAGLCFSEMASYQDLTAFPWVPGREANFMGGTLTC